MNNISFGVEVTIEIINALINVKNGLWNIFQNHLTSELHRAYIKKRRLFAY